MFVHLSSTGNVSSLCCEVLPAAQRYVRCPADVLAACSSHRPLSTAGSAVPTHAELKNAGVVLLTNGILASSQTTAHARGIGSAAGAGASSNSDEKTPLISTAAAAGGISRASSTADDGLSTASSALTAISGTVAGVADIPPSAESDLVTPLSKRVLVAGDSPTLIVTADTTCSVINIFDLTMTQCMARAQRLDDEVLQMNEDFGHRHAHSPPNHHLPILQIKHFKREAYDCDFALDLLVTAKTQQVCLWSMRGRTAILIMI